MTTKTAPKLSIRLASNLVTGRFELESPIADGGWWFGDAESAKASPLAEKLMAVETVSGVKISGSTVSVTRDSYEDWHLVAKTLAGLISEHAVSGKPVVKPGTPSNLPSAEKIREVVEQVLDAEVNPAVASHGGEIRLVDVKGTNVYVQLMGGCHGCASSTVTLKQGVERALRDAVPQIDDIIDVTDHATGENPYHKG